jgi:hypothetical protein
MEATPERDEILILSGTQGSYERIYWKLLKIVNCLIYYIY